MRYSLQYSGTIQSVSQFYTHPSIDDRLWYEYDTVLEYTVCVRILSERTLHGRRRLIELADSGALKYRTYLPDGQTDTQIYAVSQSQINTVCFPLRQHADLRCAARRE